jgi:hypothetical protein
MQAFFKNSQKNFPKFGMFIRLVFEQGPFSKGIPFWKGPQATSRHSACITKH